MGAFGCLEIVHRSICMTWSKDRIGLVQIKLLKYNVYTLYYAGKFYLNPYYGTASQTCPWLTV
jgi:hypothetical protein